MPEGISLKEAVRAEALRLGFDLAGFVSADGIFTVPQSVQDWIALGYCGDLDYMKRFGERLAALRERFPDAKSAVVLAVNYYAGDPAARPGEDFGRVARYAWGRDYHRAIEKRLKRLERFIQGLAPNAKTHRYVDTGPLLERRLAVLAGFGFVGKNTNLITKRFGSWVFLSEILTDFEIPPDRPAVGDCGTCRLCLEACPTQALTEPFRLDARKCIAYLTIEHKGPIDPALEKRVSPWVFGCDICLEVCPHNRGARIPKTAWEELQPQEQAPGWVDLSWLNRAEPPEIQIRFQGRALLRSKAEGLKRNASVSS